MPPFADADQKAVCILAFRLEFQHIGNSRPERRLLHDHPVDIGLARRSAGKAQRLFAVGRGFIGHGDFRLSGAAGGEVPILRNAAGRTEFKGTVFEQVPAIRHTRADQESAKEQSTHRLLLT